MHRIAVLVTVVVTLVSGLTPAVRGAEQVRGYIYDEIGRFNNLAIVINATAHDVDIMSKARAHIGDSGGNYDDCGNGHYIA